MISMLVLGTNLISPITTVTAQPSSFDSIDAFIQDQIEHMLIPGISYGIVQDNETVHSNAFGKADSDGTLMTAQTPMILGGISKSFTSLAIMQLVEAENISLDQTVQSIFPNFAVNNPAESMEITIEHCIYHFSGIPTNPNIAILINDTFEDMILKYSEISLSSSPGTQFLYSNYNHIVLAAIIENITGNSFENYLRTNIADPLSMDNFFVSSEDGRENGLSYGYQPFFGIQKKSNIGYAKTTIQTEGLIASAEDMTHYMIAHLNEGTYTNETLLNQTNIPLLHNIPEKYSENTYYAMGWANHTLGDKEVISHLGNLDDTFADMMLIPSEGIGAVVLINTNNFIGQTAYYQELVPSILKLLMEEEITVRNMSFLVLYLIIDLFIMLTLVAEGRRYFNFESRIKRFLADFNDPKEKRSQAIGKTVADILIIPFIIFGVPGIVSLVMGIPGFNLKMLLNMQQDLGLWIIFYAFSSLVQAILRIVYFKKKRIY